MNKVYCQKTAKTFGFFWPFYDVMRAFELGANPTVSLVFTET